MRSSFRTALLAGLAVGLCLPGSALASSIALIQRDNVWLVSPDGSHRKQVTRDGTADRPYSSPSQADDGTILAEVDRRFVRLRPDGRRIGAPIPGLGSDVRHSGNVTVMAGPAAPRISPDGTRFAYWISARGMTSCPIWEPGCSYEDTDFTIVSHVDRFTPPAEFGVVNSYRDPSWVGNDRLLLFSHGVMLQQGAIARVGAGQSGLRQWFDPPYRLPQVDQGQLTRRGDKLVALAGSTSSGFSEDYVFLYAVAPGLAAPPEPKCYIRDAAPPSREFTQPTWSPDGTQLAVTESDGVHVFSNVPDLRAGSPNCAQISERALGYGSEPGWGPADVPTAGMRRRGATVRVRLRVAVAGSTVRLRLLACSRGPLLGRAVRRHVPEGRQTFAVSLNRRGRAALRGSGRLCLSVRVKLKPPRGRSTTAIRRVVLRR